MKINGKEVLNFLRVSPRLLVCGLEGDSTYSFRGDKQYVDDQETALKKAMSANNTLTLNASDPLREYMRLVATPVPEDEVLPLPTYNFQPDREQVQVVNAAVGLEDDGEHLPLPSYDFSRFRS